MNSKKSNSEGKCENVQELGPETIVTIEKARARIKKGYFLTEEEAKLRLKL